MTSEYGFFRVLKKAVFESFDSPERVKLTICELIASRNRRSAFERNLFLDPEKGFPSFRESVSL